jgi:2-amino-4-hydroxy-6-hydroxymethyldihydropteridine diphosphokinase
MATVYVSIGSNIEPERYVAAGVAALRGAFGALALSPVYRSEAVGFAGAPFLNLVARFETDREVREVNRMLHLIEDAHGRDRSGPRFSSRSLDLDLILYDELVIREDQGHLEVPRRDILDYAFVLRPLADLAPDARHPITGNRYADLWARFDQASQPLERVDIPLESEP